MPTHLNPAKRWREGSRERTSFHLDWCADPRTHELLEAAFAEYALRLSAPTSTEAAVCHYKLEGARALMDVVLNMGEVQMQRPPPQEPKLTPPEEGVRKLAMDPATRK